MLTNLMIEEVHRDRRRRPRLRLSCSLRLYRRGGAPTVVARTEDISCEGFHFTSEHPFELNERLEYELIIQGEETGYHSEADVILRGKAEVVRVAPKGLKEGFSVACRLEDYTVDREVPANSGLEEFFVEPWTAQATPETNSGAKQPFLVAKES